MDLLIANTSNAHWNVLQSTGTSFSVVDTGALFGGWNTKPAAMDVNGDGRQDLVYFLYSGWYIRLNNGNGFDVAINTGIQNPTWEHRLVIDYDGDGMMDLLTPDINNRWHVLRSTGSTFQLIKSR